MSDNVKEDTGSAPQDIAEEIAEALRNNQWESLASNSPYVACLFPLLKALGWKNFTRELIEALPHFARDLDLVDLRNILVEIGYESTPLKASIADIAQELYPCLFVSRTGDVYILLNRQDDVIEVFDAQIQEKRQLPANAFKTLGTAYVFTDRQSAQVKTGGPRLADDGWFQALLGRFRKLLIHLFGMTLVVNLIALSVPLAVMLIYDKVIGAKSIDALPMILSGAALLIMTDFVLRYIRAQMLGIVAGRMDYLIGVETFKKLLSLPPLNIEQSTIHAQLSQLKQFDSLREFFTGQSASIMLELPFVLLSLLVIALLAGSVAVIPVVMMVVYGVASILWLPRINEKVMRAGVARTQKQQMLLQSLSGRKEIKAIGGEKIWKQRFREISGDAVLANYQTFVQNAVMNSFSQAVMSLTALLVLGWGALLVIDGQMTIGALIATMALVWRVLSPLQNVFLSIPKLQQTIKSIRQINQLMKLPAERHNFNSGLVLNNIAGNIWINSLSFRYGPNQNPALLGVSMAVKAGEFIAIVGHTGSGKSTLLKMIAGMYSPQGGVIMIDGLDLRQLNITELRRNIAYVPQETRVFHGTIAQNLRLANGLASDKDLQEAAAKAGILDDILALPQGFATRLTDKALEQYPPGFLRALSIARALVTQSKIVLFDEPGASLDFESDQRFVQQLQALKHHCTIVMVSHRPSHIRLADRVVVLEKGQVKYSGEPEQAISLLMQG